MSKDEAYKKTLEMPSADTKLSQQQSSKTHHNNINNQADTPPQIPSMEISKQSRITEKDLHNTCPIRKHSIPKIIITPPDYTSTTRKEKK